MVLRVPAACGSLCVDCVAAIRVGVGGVPATWQLLCQVLGSLSWHGMARPVMHAFLRALSCFGLPPGFVDCAGPFCWLLARGVPVLHDCPSWCRVVQRFQMLLVVGCYLALVAKLVQHTHACSYCRGLLRGGQRSACGEVHLAGGLLHMRCVIATGNAHVTAAHVLCRDGDREGRGKWCAADVLCCEHGGAWRQRWVAGHHA